MKKIILYLFLILFFQVDYMAFGSSSGDNDSFQRRQDFFGFGALGGVVISDFTGDSSGYRGIAMPFGGFYGSIDITKRFTLSVALNLLTKGINIDKPYARYRYSYYSTQILGQLRPLNFIELELGYRYGMSIKSEKVVLNPINTSGLGRKPIPGFGSYGQWLLGVGVRLDPSTALFFNYGFSGRETPMSHFKIGVRVNLYKKLASSSLDTNAISRRSNAYYHASKLKDGLLLVRLQTRQSSINTLKAMGREDESIKLKEEVEKNNMELIEAFEEYNFSKVLYFYDIHSAQIKEGIFDTILMDKNLNIVPAPHFEGELYIALFGNYASPEVSYHAQRNFQYLKNHNIPPDSASAWVQYRHTGLGIGGIIITNNFFEPLEKPFPVFTKTVNRTIFRTGNMISRSVSRLNDDLYVLYYKARQ